MNFLPLLMKAMMASPFMMRNCFLTPVSCLSTNLTPLEHPELLAMEDTLMYSQSAPLMMALSSRRLVGTSDFSMISISKSVAPSAS